jgi:hypothetical protein
VLDLILVGKNFTTSSKYGAVRHIGVGGVQHQVGGPIRVGREHVVLDIGCVAIIDIKGVRLELKDIPHVRQLNVVDSATTDIEKSRSFCGELTGNTEGERLVQT